MITRLKEHLERYPQMQVQDVAKLFYQSEFGGGHMIADPGKSLKRICEEYKSMEKTDSEFVIEDIGDDMCRIYLSCITKGMKEEVLNQIFVMSANQKAGTLAGLEEKIRLITEACQTGELSFDLQEMTQFFAKWKEQDYPAMSHSQIYREAYHPAYRVVKKSFLKVYETIQKILGKDEICVVAIDGMCASGKSTLAELLYLNFPESRVFHVDDYFLQPHQRTAERMAEIGGNLDYERFKEEIVDHLSDKEGLTYRPFSCRTQSIGEEIHVPWKPLTIIEGSYSHHPYFGDAYDLRIFSDVDRKEQIERLRARNGEAMLVRFQEEWIPKELAYFEKFNIGK